jgi:hypothetical protein
MRCEKCFGSFDRLGYPDELVAGRIAFAHLIRVWHERNGWSHKVLPALAEHLGLGRVHSSQLSKLRNGKLPSPGPELFLTLGRLNQLLAAEAGPAGLSERLQQRLQGELELLAALQTSALAVLGEGGAVLGPGELLEVFVGLRLPPAPFDLRIADAEAADLSAALALLFTAGKPWRLCREALLAAYPSRRHQLQERFAEVMAGLRDYSATELEAELPDLVATARALGIGEGKALDANGLLELLRR